MPICAITARAARAAAEPEHRRREHAGIGFEREDVVAGRST